MAIVNAKHPGRLDYPAQEIANLGLYFVRSDPFDSTGATGEVEMFNIPAGTLIHSIGWNTLVAWNDSQISQPVILVGDTATYDLYGMLGQAELGSTHSGVLAEIMWESTADSKVCIYVVSGGGKIIAPTTGQAELWLSFRPKSESQPWVIDT